MEMTPVDFLIVGVVFVSAAISWLRGFTKEAISLLSWLLGLAAALRFTDRLAPHLPESLTLSSTRHMVAFVIIFVAVIVFGGAVSYMVNMKVSNSALSSVNRSLGILFGAVRGLLIACIAVAYLSTTEVTQHVAWQHSVLVKKLDPLIRQIRQAAPQALSSEMVIERYPGGITPLFKRE